MRKKRKKASMAAPLSIFWIIWCERNYIAFENKDFSTQRMKTSFICNLLSWSNVYIDERPRSLVDFLIWLGCRCGLVGIVFCVLVGFCFAYLFSLSSSLGGTLLYTNVYL